MLSLVPDTASLICYYLLDGAFPVSDRAVAGMTYSELRAVTKRLAVLTATSNAVRAVFSHVWPLLCQRVLAKESSTYVRWKWERLCSLLPSVTAPAEYQRLALITSYEGNPARLRKLLRVSRVLARSTIKYSSRVHYLITKPRLRCVTGEELTRYGVTRCPEWRISLTHAHLPLSEIKERLERRMALQEHMNARRATMRSLLTAHPMS